MSDNDSGHETYKRLEFDKETRARLYGKLYDAILSSGRLTDSYAIEWAANGVISCMEGFADLLSMSDRWKPEKQQRRKERIDSLANHFDGLIEQIRALDSPALGYVLSCGFDESAKIRNVSNPFKSSFDAIFAAEEIQDSNAIKELSAFSFGLRKAAETLPQHKENTSGKDYELFSQPSQLAAASALERLFVDYQIKFSITNTGLAADCLRAIYALGGIKIDRVDFWLKKARDHWDSQTNFLRRPQKRNEE